MEILVVGGTGTLGSRVVKASSERGHSVRVLTRDPAKARALPPGARAVSGSLQQPSTLTEAFRGVDAAFLLTPLAPDETDQGLAGVRAAREASVPRLVYTSVILPPDSHHIPHFASKLPIEEAVRVFGGEWTVVRPNSFFQNDEMAREVILGHGVYPHPLGPRGANRVDAADIAAVAVEALTTDRLNGRIVPVNGPEAMNGEQVAGIWSRHVGRDVRYAGDDLDAWERGARGAGLPDWLVHDLRIMYEYFHERGLPASPADLAELRDVLGREPRRFDDYASETAARWRREGSGGEGKVGG